MVFCLISRSSHSLAEWHLRGSCPNYLMVPRMCCSLYHWHIRGVDKYTYFFSMPVTFFTFLGCNLSKFEKNHDILKKKTQFLWPVSAPTSIVFRLDSEVYETSWNASVQNYMICATLVLARQRERCFVKNAVKMLEIHNFLSNLIFNLSNFR